MVTDQARVDARFQAWKKKPEEEKQKTFQAALRLLFMAAAGRHQKLENPQAIYNRPEGNDELMLAEIVPQLIARDAAFKAVVDNVAATWDKLVGKCVWSKKDWAKTGELSAFKCVILNRGAIGKIKAKIEGEDKQAYALFNQRI